MYLNCKMKCLLKVNYILFVYFRTLPPQFPQDPPSITVQPLVNHQWVDPQGKLIGCPNLNSVSLKNVKFFAFTDWGHLSDLTLPHLCACPKSVPRFPSASVISEF